MKHALLGFVGSLVFASTAMAGDFYVDAVNGSNANAGTSPAAAWRTITHAAANVPSPRPHTIHVAAGVYDAALGEVFPIYLPPGSLLGAGPGSTVIDGGGTFAALLQMQSITSSPPGWSFVQSDVIGGMTLRAARVGIEISSNWNPASPTLRDLDVVGMSSMGLSLSVGGFGAGIGDPRLERVRAHSNPVGFEIIGGGVQTDVTAFDCEFTGNTVAGVKVVTGVAMTLDFTRCKIDGNAGHGMRVSYINLGSVTANLMECSLSANAGDGFNGVLSPALGNTLRGNLDRCTIAMNGGVGVRAEDNIGSASHPTDLACCIVYGNADDILHTGSVTASYSDIGDGDFSGQNGNFSADPRFRNPAQGDFSLTVGSPCVDAGDPTKALDPDCTVVEVGAYALLSPRVFCTAKLNSCGGAPSIGARGTPSASASSGFIVQAVNAKALKYGLLIYTDTGPQIPPAPFQGGLLCLGTTQIKRSVPVVDTLGTAGQCNGVLAIDMNAFAAGALGGNPLASLAVPGTQVDCQFWGRDSPFSSLVTDALEYVVCP